jgi:hypothetical protein
MIILTFSIKNKYNNFYLKYFYTLRTLDVKIIFLKKSKKLSENNYFT